jgi:hypothetical protein
MINQTKLIYPEKKGLKASGHVEAKTHTDLRKMRQDGASRLNDGGQHRSTATMVHHTRRCWTKASSNKLYNRSTSLKLVAIIFISGI